MALSLPTAIAAYFAAERNQDFDALAQCFSEQGSVLDEGGAHKGPAAIAQWAREAKRKYGHTTEPLSASEVGGKVVVIARIAGSFPGSPIELSHAFEFAGDKIAVLKIG